jgi:hypothetical protein
MNITTPSSIRIRALGTKNFGILRGPRGSRKTDPKTQVKGDVVTAMGERRIDMVAEDPALLKKAAKQIKIELGKKQTTFHITGEDRPGAVAEALAKLAAKEINVYAAQALCARDGRFGALIQVDQDAVKKAAKASA